MKKYSKNNVQIFKTAEALNTAAVKSMITISNKSILARKRFVISLSGGNTPKKLYTMLSKAPFREQIKWKRTFVFWGDERCVPLDDEQNNAHQSKLLLLNKINIPISNIHAVPVHLPPLEAAKNYEKEIKKYFKNNIPRFDLILLGLGENGHTASLFPETRVIKAKTEGVRAIYIKEEKMSRITMTAPMINQARTIIFLVTGKEKAEILNTVLTSTYQPYNYPAQLIKPYNGELLWFVDKNAARLLKNVN